MVEVRDRDGSEFEQRSKGSDGRDNRRLFRAGCKTKRAVLDVATGDNQVWFRLGEQKCCTDAKSAVRGIGVLCHDLSAAVELVY